MVSATGVCASPRSVHGRGGRNRYLLPPSPSGAVSRSNSSSDRPRIRRCPTLLCGRRLDCSMPFEFTLQKDTTIGNRYRTRDPLRLFACIEVAGCNPWIDPFAHLFPCPRAAATARAVPGCGSGDGRHMTSQSATTNVVRPANETRKTPSRRKYP